MTDLRDCTTEEEYQEELDRRTAEVDYVYDAVRDGTITLPPSTEEVEELLDREDATERDFQEGNKIKRGDE